MRASRPSSSLKTSRCSMQRGLSPNRDGKVQLDAILMNAPL